MTTQEKIEQYLDHMQDLDYIDALLKSTELNVMFDIITKILQSGKQERIFVADLFIRDAMLFAQSETSSQFFREGFYTSTIVAALNKNVFANLHFVRHDTVYTIGKVGLKTSVDILLEAFRHYLESDPLLLPGMLFELSWLGDTHQWGLIEQMAHSARDLTRWAILSTYLFDSFQVAQNEEESIFAELQAHYLDLLKADTHNLIRREAEYKEREFRFAQAAGSLSKTERKKERKALELDAPPITFEIVSIRFGNYMVQTHKDDFSLTELEAFVLQM